MKEKGENELVLIQKTEQYIEYVLNMLIKLPRTENKVLVQNISHLCME